MSKNPTYYSLTTNHYHMNILITWTNSWIWKAIKEGLWLNHNIFKVSKNQSEEDNFFKCDLCKNEEIKNLDFKNTIFDLLIFNAWVWQYWDFSEYTEEMIDEIIKLNLLSPIRLLKKLKNNINKNTKLIFIWSIASKKFMKNWSVYLASKFGLRWFAWWLKEDWKKVHIINPKIVDTNFHKNKLVLPDNVKPINAWDIVSVIENIISGKEVRFEIDL